MSKHTLKSTHHKSFENNITAGTTQTQAGGTALTADINTIITTANDNDAVVLPTIKEGDEIKILNDGAKDLQVFPASGNNLGNGLNQSMILESNERIKFFAKSETEWDIEDSTEILHGAMGEEDNTTAFTISKVTELHCYHSTGLAAEDVAGWNYQSGGTRVIDEILNEGGGDIRVRTSTAHNLAVGDVISQNNMIPTDSNYTKVFVVKTIVDSIHYTVTATYTAGVTSGTMNKAATLTCQDIAAGAYLITYDISAIATVSGEIFKFFVYKNATKIPRTKRKKTFTLNSQLYDVSKSVIDHIDSGDKISLVLRNATAAMSWQVSVAALFIVPDVTPAVYVAVTV